MICCSQPLFKDQQSLLSGFLVCWYCCFLLLTSICELFQLPKKEKRKRRNVSCFRLCNTFFLGGPCKKIWLVDFFLWWLWGLLVYHLYPTLFCWVFLVLNYSNYIYSHLLIKKTKFKLKAIKLPKKITWKKNNLCTYQNPK